VPGHGDNGDPLGHIQPVELVMQKCRQSANELPCVGDDAGNSVKHPLQDVSDCLR